jgi:hypothetical protein
LGSQGEGATEQPLARLLHALALVPLIRIVWLTAALGALILATSGITALLCEWVVRGTGSIMGISVCHGITSIALLLLSPSVPVLCATSPSGQPDRPPPLK